METRVAIIGIIVENPAQVGALNAILHEYSQYIIGRIFDGVDEKEAVDALVELISGNFDE